MTRLVVMVMAAALSLKGSYRPQPGTPKPVLTLEDVLESVGRSYPPLLAAMEELGIADGDVLTAAGKFDFSLKARMDSDRLGYYANERFDVGFEQPLAATGSSLYGGWSVSRGTYPSYEGKLDTNSGGQFRTGWRQPLLRDRAIDSRRGELRKAELGRKVAKLSVDQQKLVIVQTATRRYWEWVAAGQRQQVAKALLETATTRDQILREAVKLGQLAAIEVVENERAILQRRSQLVEAERGFTLTAIDLSLLYRDGNGNPVIVGAERLPPGFPAIETPAERKVEEDIERALALRPEVARLSVQRDQTKVDADVARNQRLPGVDLLLGYTRESGEGVVKRGPNELSASLVFDLPFQRRAAAGRQQVAEGKMKQIDHRERFARDQVIAEVKDALSAVEAARRRAFLSREELGVARKLEDAERTRFDLGDSTLFLLNLREQATFDAATREVGAQADYFRAYAQYELAVAAALGR